VVFQVVHPEKMINQALLLSCTRGYESEREGEGSLNKVVEKNDQASSSIDPTQFPIGFA
jgi:hypothetical protein